MRTLVGISALALGVVVMPSCGGLPDKPLEGKVKRETISIAPKVPGRILKIYVDESSVVKKGDTLAMIDIPEVEAKMLQAEGAIFAASNQYAMAEHGATKEQKEQVIAMYNAAKEQYSFAEKSLGRVRRMYDDSLVSSQAYDEALAKFSMAMSQYQAAAAKKQEVENGARDEQVNMAKGQMQQAQGFMQEVKVARGEKYIIAPRDMTIETIALHEGELALAGFNVFVGYAPETTWFRFTVSESKVMGYTVGQEREVYLPFAQRSMKARVVSISEIAKYGSKTSPYPQYQLGEAVYELKMVPTNKQEAGSLLNNFTVFLK